MGLVETQLWKAYLYLYIDTLAISELSLCNSMVKASLKVQTVNCRPCQFDIDGNGEVPAFTGIVNGDIYYQGNKQQETVYAIGENICIPSQSNVKHMIMVLEQSIQ